MLEELEQCAAGALLGVSKLTEHIFEELENHVEELMLQHSTSLGSRVLTHAKMWRWAVQVRELRADANYTNVQLHAAHADLDCVHAELIEA